MWETIINLSALATLGGVIIKVVLWSHAGLSKQIDEIRADTKLAHARIDAHMVSSNQRIDHTYELILEILRENKKDDRK